MPTYPIVHEPDSTRFVCRLEGQEAELRYTLRQGVMLFTHTGVPSALEGRGIGSALARAGLEYARVHNLRVISYCWFISGFIERHPEYQELQK